MKCCDSMTSAIAASTSDLMEAYCDLRSSNGTFMLRFLFQLAVRFAALAQLGGQRRLLVEIKAAEHAGRHLDVPVPALRTHHDAIRAGRFQLVSVAAHPAGPARRIALNERVVGDILRDDRPGGDEHVAADGPAAHDRGVG